MNMFVLLPNGTNRKPIPDVEKRSKDLYIKKRDEKIVAPL